MLHKLQMKKFPNKKQAPFWHIEIFAKSLNENRREGQNSVKKLKKK